MDCLETLKQVDVACRMCRRRHTGLRAFEPRSCFLPDLTHRTLQLSKGGPCKWPHCQIHLQNQQSPWTATLACPNSTVPQISRHAPDQQLALCRTASPRRQSQAASGLTPTLGTARPKGRAMRRFSASAWLTGWCRLQGNALPAPTPPAPSLDCGNRAAPASACDNPLSVQLGKHSRFGRWHRLVTYLLDTVTGCQCSGHSASLWTIP